MARKRMFDSEIINQDSFLDLPTDSKALYFLLGMEADDEGFVSPKRILRLHGIHDDSLRLLIVKNFLIPFESGVVAITDWKRNNYLDSTRVKETIYQEEKGQIDFDDNKVKYVCLTEVKQKLNEYRIEENSIEENRIDEKIIDNTSCLTLIKQKKDSKYEKEFEILWELYPNKKGKKKALGYYINSRKNGTTYENVEKGIYNYLNYINSEKIEIQFIKNGSTWFNQECWNDEYLVRKKTLKDISMFEIDEALKIEQEQTGDNNDETIRIY